MTTLVNSIKQCFFLGGRGDLLLANFFINSSERPGTGTHSSIDFFWPYRLASSSAYPGASNMIRV